MATYKNINGDYVISTLSVDDNIVVTTTEVDLNGNLVVNGNIRANVITAAYYLGDGQFLTNVVSNIGAASKLQNGTSNVDIPIPNGNITFGIDFINNIIVVSQGTTTINQTTPAINNLTGALTVAGGVGIAGDLYVGGTIYENYQAVLNVNSVINGGTY
jgi:hypothetical protein